MPRNLLRLVHAVTKDRLAAFTASLAVLIVVAVTAGAAAVGASDDRPEPAPAATSTAPAPAGYAAASFGFPHRIVIPTAAPVAAPARQKPRRVTHRPTGSPRAIGRDLAARRGWTGSQWTCLDRLWTRESNWRVDETNGSSGAYGIPQSLPASKMASAGGDWRSNPTTQIRWGLGYIAGRYGSPCSAWHHSQSYNYY